jgi:hypothetical protein
MSWLHTFFTTNSLCWPSCPTFKGVWSAAANFVPLSPLDTRSGQYPQHHR